MLEVDQRTNDGITVTLWYNKLTDSTHISIQQGENNAPQVFEVPQEKAHRAFYHPFAFAPEREYSIAVN